MIEGPYTAERIWTPQAGMTAAKIAAAVVELRSVQNWKPLTVITGTGAPTQYPAKKPRKV